jgi:hypothetical protein
MAYSKGKSSGAFMNNASGMCSYKDGKVPMKQASQVKPECGPGMGGYQNADQSKANKLLQKAQKQQDSLRGMASY